MDIKIIESFDDGNILEFLSKVEARLESLESQSKETGAAVDQSFAEGAAAAADMGNAVEKSEKQLDSATNAVKANDKALTVWRQHLKNSIDSTQIAGKSVGEWKEQLNQTRDSLKSAAAGTEGMTKASKLLNIVLKLSPIFLLAGVIAAVVVYFSKFQKGMDLISKVTAGASAVLDTLIKRVGAFGEGIVSIFSGNFTEGFDKIKQSVTGLGSAIADAAKAGYQLEASLQALEQAQIRSRVEAFQQKAAIDKLKEAGDDETATIKGRIGALRQAGQVSQEYYDREIKLAKEAARLAAQQFGQSGKGRPAEIELGKKVIELNELIAEREKNTFEIEKSLRDARKTAAEERKKQLEDEEKRLLDIEKLKIEALKDGLEKELAQEDFRAKELRKKLVAAGIETEQADEQHQLNRQNIKLKYYLADLAIQTAALEAEKEALQNGYDELEAIDKQREDERLKRAADNKKVQDQFAEVDRQNFELTQLSLRKIFFERKRSDAEIQRFEAAAAKAKEIFDLQERQKELQRALTFGANLTETERLILEKRIAVLQGQIEQAGQDQDGKGKFSFAELFGVSNEQFAGIQAAAQNIIGSINQILDARIQAASKARELADQEVADAEKRLEDERDRNEKGIASNIEIAEKELAQKKAARDKALKEEQAAARAKERLDTVGQLTSLITASANIFQSVSSIPIVGVPLAIGLIATMFAAFGAAKLSARKASETKLRHGGELLVGPSHEDGGIDIAVGGRRRYEAEGGEWVVNKKDSREHNAFIRRLNSGEARGLNLSAMLDYYKASTGPGALHGHAILATDASRKLDAVQSTHVTRNEFAMWQQRIIDEIKTRPSYAPWDGGYIEIKNTGHGTHRRKFRPSN